MRNTKWIYNTNKNSSGAINNSPDIDKDILFILNNRGIVDPISIKKFLNSEIKDISDPFTLKDMDITVDRLLDAIDSKESIWIYGDYDVDGITATSLLYLVLTKLGANIKYHIPLRNQGYGLNNEAIEEIKNNGCSIIVTVDCGISSIAEAEFCNSLGMDLIITDHHEINNQIPPAFSIINPKREENIYSFKYLSGVGTIFMVVLALYTKLGRKDEAFQFLDIVAIGTVADIVPLIEENRIFTKIGINQLLKSKSLGLKMLISQIFPDWSTRIYTPFDIGFGIAPVFNAVGRLEDAKQAVELFIGNDSKILNGTISYLLEKNVERKKIQENIYENVLKKIEDYNLNQNNIIIVGDEGFHHGVIGIVASKIVDKYYKPTIIYEIKKEENIAVASCRSIESFDITKALTHVSSYLLKYGGHSQAAGFSISIDKLEEFKNKLYEYANREISDYDLIEKIKIEKELPIFKISYDFLNKLSNLEPYGMGNSTPIFSITNCSFYNLRLIGKDRNHIMLSIKKGDLELKNCVWFRSGDIYDELYSLNNSNIDIAFRLKLEIYKDRYQYKPIIIDIKKSENVESSHKLNNFGNLKNIHFPIKTVIYTKRQIDQNNFSLDFYADKISILYNKSYIDKLDSNIFYILNTLKNNYNYTFKVSCEKIIKTLENYNIHISLERNYSFESYAIKENVLFNEIKYFLIWNFSYNNIQKNILRAIFFDKRNAIVKIDRGRGISTIIKTIGLYYKNINKKAALISNEDFAKDIRESLYIESSINKIYDFYIFLYPSKEQITKLHNYLNNNKNIENKFLIIGDKASTLTLKDFHEIIDIYNIPDNLKLIKGDGVDSTDVGTECYSKVLPLDTRKNLIDKFKEGNSLLATEDILPFI
ncbi:MAG: single-stranded-DNA-specific exonuclease RecJ [Fusobacteriaceae bacterium]|jgi:single-stranded-DNA-specific exonuclease|nr:single-stranded-DNA-specific exonuclease RecJ [Fusobacteriaceae bacterium]